MNLRTLDNYGACEPARNWFIEKFGEEASTAKVLRSASKEHTSWVEWYLSQVLIPKLRRLPTHVDFEYRARIEQAWFELAIQIGTSYLPSCPKAERKDLREAIATIKKIKRGVSLPFEATQHARDRFYETPCDSVAEAMWVVIAYNCWSSDVFYLCALQKFAPKEFTSFLRTVQTVETSCDNQVEALRRAA